MSDTFKTITSSVGEGFYSEKRSKFLAFAHHVETEDDVKNIIAEYRKKYYDARHVCYAYILGPEKKLFRANDAGEPAYSAGKPILGQIVSHDLTDVLVVVVRYYGGVNLGVGGLINAYHTAASDAIDHSEIVSKFVEEQLVFNFSYPQLNDVMKIIKAMQPRIISQSLENTCSITLSIRKSKASELRSRFENIAFK
jgi:uncharacterized YigZ family protein